MIGERFGRLVVIALAPGRTVVVVRCDCGTTKRARSSDLRKGTKSCGCHARDRMRARNFRHGQAQRTKVASEWITWRSMRQRCEDPNHKSYAAYGGRGIRVCAEWHSFERFLADMGPKPADLQLERVDNAKGYSKDNCIWATRSAQARNRRERARLADGTFAPATGA